MPTASQTQQASATSPTVTSVGAAAPGTVLRAGQAVRFTLGVSEAVRVDPAAGGAVPTLLLGNGGVATYDSAASASTLLAFTYVVAPGQDTGGLTVTSLALNGATISGVLGDAVFQAPQAYAAGSRPLSIAVADVNSDGRLDLVAANFGDGTLSVLPGDGAGGFGARTDYPAGSGPASIAVADVNSDGKPDLVAVNNGSNTVSVLLGNGNGFSAGTSYATGSRPLSIAVADVNSDNRPDLVAANFGDGTLSVLFGNGSGGFGARTDYPAGSGPASIAVADVNSDGRPDLVAANFGDGTLSVLPGDGAGGFGAAVSRAVTLSPRSLAVADVNGDGTADVVTANFDTGTVSVLPGDGAGGFGAEMNYATGGGPASIAVADVNGDGRPDLVTADYFAGTVSVLHGDGQGGFNAAVSHAAGGGPASIAVADVNSDGRADLVAGNEDGTVSVLRSAAPASLSLNAASNTGLSIDTLAPAVPAALGIDAVPGLMLRGGAEAGSRVDVFDGAVPLGSVAAGPGQGWSLLLPADLAPGAHALRATATDAAGNASAASAVLPVTVRDGAPAGADPGTVSFDAGARGASAARTGAGDAVLTRGGGVEVLRNTDELRFIDGRLVFDQDDPASQVARLYRAGLGRDVDQGGLDHWMDALGRGAPLSSIAGGFLDSDEGEALYAPGMADGDFVARLYRNILGREGDSGGQAFWTGRLGDGASRADVLTALADSAESRISTAALLPSGVWDLDEGAAAVARLYDTVLGRAPDAGGLAFWAGAVNGGASLQGMAEQFMASPEYQAAYGALSNGDFVQALYQNVLGRPGDAQGAGFWTAQLDAGGSRSAVAVSFSESPEHAALTAPDITGNAPGGFGIRLG